MTNALLGCLSQEAHSQTELKFYSDLITRKSRWLVYYSPSNNVLNKHKQLDLESSTVINDVTWPFNRTLNEWRISAKIAYIIQSSALWDIGRTPFLDWLTHYIILWMKATFCQISYFKCAHFGQLVHENSKFLTASMNKCIKSVHY